MLILLLSSRHASSKSVLQRAKRWREILAGSLQASHRVRARQSRSPFSPSPQTGRLTARTHRSFLTFSKISFFFIQGRVR